jgi:hypothetical protein
VTAPALDPLAHFQVIRGLLATLPSEIRLYEDDVPVEPVFPYVVLRMTTGSDESEQFSGTQGRADFWVWVTCVGLTGDSARVVAREVRARLAGVRPEVAGRVCNPIKRESSLPVQADRDVTVPGTDLHPMYGVDGYHFISRAA